MGRLTLRDLQGPFYFHHSIKYNIFFIIYIFRYVYEEKEICYAGKLRIAQKLEVGADQGEQTLS